MHHPGTLTLPAPPSGAVEPAVTPVVRLAGVHAGYGASDVLRGVELRVAPGERLGVLGPNGGGKTTLFRVLLGEVRPSAGTVERPDRIGLVPQTERSRLDFPVSALDVALMGSISSLPWWRQPGRAQRRGALDALGAVGMAERAQETFGSLSGGQRQRVLVARALVQDAPLILLDEPFTGMDRASTEQLERLLDALAAEGRALLVATHDVTQARRWDRVLCLNGDQVALGPPESTLTTEVLERTYGGHIVTLPDGAGRALLPPHHHGPH